MARTRLLNKLSQLAYKRQRNYCVKLLKGSKKDFCYNLNMKKVTDNKHFWKIMEPNFNDKILKDEKIILAGNDNVVTSETDLAKIFNDFFENIVKVFILNVLVKSTSIRTRC